jgi:hypothetical protein
LLSPVDATASQHNDVFPKLFDEARLSSGAAPMQSLQMHENCKLLVKSQFTGKGYKTIQHDKTYLLKESYRAVDLDRNPQGQLAALLMGRPQVLHERHFCTVHSIEPMSHRGCWCYLTIEVQMVMSLCRRCRAGLAPAHN